ncbi:MAG TPA: HAMP domain-containing sensor histidine kinase [Acidimicrobiales bacterium]|nr:HAMP domain-containing sensor histidine kinase [Acidimicrobiales bacterium]
MSGGARAPFAVLVDRSAYKAVAARWAARNFVGGGVGSALLAVFILIFYGRPDGFRPMGIFVLGAGFVACGLLFPLLFRRSLTAGMTASGALTALAVAGYTAGVGRHLAAAVAGAAVMVAASAPILYPRRWAICILAGELATTGLVLATEPHYTAAANRIILLILQTSLFAVLMIWFASTLTGLAARERQARAETERTRAELLGVDDRRRNFLHQMSHELRTPLNAIIGFAEMVHLGMAGPLEERQQQYLEPIIASGRHLLALVGDVLDGGRHDGSPLEIEAARFPVARVVDASVALCREQAHRMGVELTVDCPEAVGEITADERKVKQVLLNLLSNALKFTPRDGAIRVVVRPSADGVEMAVSDTGRGVEPADRDRIFRAYEQAGTGHPGTGLGLAVARDLAESHGGRLELAEGDEGPGATFALWMPRRPDFASLRRGPRREGTWDRTSPTAHDDPGILDEGSALERLAGPGGLARDRARIIGVTVLAETAGMAGLYLLPKSIRFHLPGWPWLAPGLLAFGLFFMHPRVRISARMLFVMTLGAVAVTAWYIWQVGADLAPSMTSILVMEGIAAFTFFRLRRAVVVGIEIAAVFGYVAAFQPRVELRFLQWVLPVSMVASGALLARWLLGYLPELVESESRARRETEVVNRQLRAASRHKGEFLAAMSHELRTPLNAVIGYAEALVQGIFGPLPPQAAEYLGEVAAAGRHLLALINDILDLAKADAGHVRPSTAPTSVSSVMVSATIVAGERAAQSGIDFDVIVGDVPDVQADAGLLARAVACLVDNAVSYSPPGGTIRLSATAGQAGVRIAVRDSGPGIDPADHERIFAAFEHGGPGRAGTGIGLALARRLVELHGGTLSLESRPGEGSQFFIDLPAAAADQEASAAAISSPTSGAR